MMPVLPIAASVWGQEWCAIGNVVVFSGTVELVFELDDEGLVVGGVGPPIEPGGESKPSELSRTIVAAVVDEHDLDRDGDALHFRLLKRARRR